MAIDQQPIARQITLPTTQVSAGSGTQQLANAASAVSQVLTERINDVAISQAAIQGEKDVQDETQPQKLALPFTRATKAYNNAVSDTEARRMVASAENLINESLANSTNPATFGRDTPAKFHAELEGIKSGILQNARDENREHIREALDKMSANASISMLKHSIDFDNQQTNLDFKQDMTGLYEARRNAVIAGDMARVAGIDAALDKSLSDYSTMNAGIARMEPYYRADIAKQKAIDNVLGGFSQAISDKTTTKFMSDLAENKDKLPFNIWQEAVKGVVALDQTEKRLKNDINAVQVEQVKNGISNGSIRSAEDLLNYQALTVPQTLTFMREIETKQAKDMKEGSQLITAQQNILSGRPEFNSASTRDKMFEAQVQNLQQSTGQVATLVDMEKSVLGQNEFPASGLPGIPMGTNVPKFDSVMQGKLTGGDVMATAQAAMVYNDMVNLQDKPNSINLTGDALAVANLFNELNKGGTTPEQAAEQAINAVLKASDPQIAQRIDTFHKTLEKVNPHNGSSPLQDKFKQTFGSSPQAFGSQEAFRLFSDTYRANYISSNSEEAALNATKYSMRAWGTSKYFDKGYVGQPVPEKDVPITQVGNAFGNQIVSNLQGFINRTKAARDAHPDLNIPVIEWADPNQTITGTETEQDKVFKKFTLSDKPRIKINGHETDVVLMPSATSRLGDGVNYLFGVYDQFNNLHPLKDVTNPVDQVARFTPNELSVWAPGIASKQIDDDLRSYALKVREQEVKAGTSELKALEGKTPAWQVALGLAKPDEYLQYIATRNANSDEGRLEQIISSLKGAAGGAGTRVGVAEADNVGISPDLGLVIPGNIDLSNRPRVENPDGKISTVRTIGVQADGLEFVIPTVSDDGKLLSDKDAISLFKRTKKHLGAFKTKEEATAFAKQLHESEAAKLKQEASE